MKFLLTMIVTMFTASCAFGQVILTPDEVTGEFTARANTNTDDIRLDRTCLYRVDVYSPDPTVPVVCTFTVDGREPLPGEESPSGEGVVVDMVFTTVLVSGQNQRFVVRNIALDVGGELESENGSNSGLITSRPGAPFFVIVSP
jgi:hypothetical protein